MSARAAAPVAISPLATWLPGAAERESFLRASLGREAVVLPARDAGWRGIGPRFAEARAMAGSGLPFQVVAERRYDRSGDARRLAAALRGGATVYLPQVHQVLPRLARLMAALRAELFGPRREECSFLFLVEGSGREGMGLHHDGDVDAVWLQLEGRRTVTVGPPVPRAAPEDLPLPEWLVERAKPPQGWWTRDLAPGSLLYMPPRTPHRVVCRGRSLAVSLTWSRAEAPAHALARWDVVDGKAIGVPPATRGRLWTQVPAVLTEVGRGRRRRPLLGVDGGATVDVGPLSPAVGGALAAMPSWSTRKAAPELARLEAWGVLGPRDLPRRIVPRDPRALDGWRFA
jgi:hypothetical protein